MEGKGKKRRKERDEYIGKYILVAAVTLIELDMP